MAFSIVTQGSYTQGATAQNVTVNLPSYADYFVVNNLTQAAAASPSAGTKFEWFRGITPQGGALQYYKSGSSAILQNTISSGGFTYVSSYPNPEPAVTGTAITNANPAVVTMVNSYSNGDRVILYNTTGMLQIAGMIFTISSVSGAGFTLSGLDASGFSAPATAVTARRIAPYDRVEPEFYYITKISQASQGVVTVSQAHNYVVGQKVEFTIPGSFGMIQLNNYYMPQNLPAVITAVTTYTFTINVDTSAFTAFSFPASSSSPTAQLFATVAPAGQSTQYNPVTGVQTGYNFTQVPFRSGLFVPYMYLAAGANSPAGQANDTIVWQAWKMENT